MQSIAKAFILTIPIVLSVALVGCGSGGPTGGPSAPDPVPSSTRDTSSREVSVAGGGSLQITLTTDTGSYARGVPVQIQLQVTNTGSVPVSYTSLGPFSDATITDGSGAVVWQYSRTVPAFAAGGRVYSLAPGASVTDAIAWDQTESLKPPPPAGPYAPPGQYTITGWWQPGSLGSTAVSTSEAQAQFSPPPLSIMIQNGPTPPQQQQTQPAAPSDLTATVNSRGIILAWTTAAGDYEFNVYRRAAGAAYGAPLYPLVERNAVESSDGTPGVTYYFVVRGVGIGEIEGPSSNEVSAVAPVVSNLPPGPPGSPDGPVISRRQ
ncbi:MAG TPA: hypothetical protein VFJ58_18615 [Armatimonadota bacterium]|nr:hypothetical protein [Armatimonadota bacterium]